MELSKHRGLPLGVDENHPLEHFAAAMDYKPLDGDIIVVTYPKTGTTWMQYIAWSILHNAETYPPFEDALFRLMPYMDITGVEVVEKLPPPRLYKTHLPYNHLTINPKAKYLYVYRNPGDTFASYFHFLNERMHRNNKRHIPKDELFEMFMSGEIPYGDYFDHVLSFYPHRNDENVLFISYEDLKLDQSSEILKIAKFLGDYYYLKLTENNNALLQKIVHLTSFDYMKSHLKATGPIKWNKDNSQDVEKEEQKKPTDFFRKGIIGDGNSLLNSDQKKVLLEKIVIKMANTEFLDRWMISVTH